eukprot:JP442687.1.p2 GENE.JP442687.1~~JP442687.1.p2  ORF type:complete len:75 (+),score=8.29 JP442687.1:46-270(+)
MAETQGAVLVSVNSLLEGEHKRVCVVAVHYVLELIERSSLLSSLHEVQLAFGANNGRDVVCADRFSICKLVKLI